MTMFIHQLAQRTGISAKTIRYYESIGLPSPPVRASNQYRLYTDENVELLRFIGGARSLGYSLAEIAQLRAARENGSLLPEQAMASLDARLADIEGKIADLQLVRDTLLEIRNALVSRRTVRRVM